MSDSCKPVPYLNVDGPATSAYSDNCTQHQTSRKLLEQLSKDIVLIEIGKTPAPRPENQSKVGSGFFVNQGDEIVTNSHVGLSGEYVDVITENGTRYHTQIEKLDLTNDLALLKVFGINQDPSRAVTLDTTPLVKGDEQFTFGHPGGAPEIWVSEGVVTKAKGSLEDMVGDPDHPYPDLPGLLQLKNSPDPIIAKEAQEYLDADRIDQRVHIIAGNSGSGSFDAAGHLRAVAADRLRTAHGLFVGADKVKTLLEQPETKFKFDYDTDAAGNQHLRAISRLDGSASPPIVLRMPEKHAQIDLGAYMDLDLARFDFTISHQKLPAWQAQMLEISPTPPWLDRL